MYNPNLHFHFTGIGGSGMSGLAEILLNLGFKVSGTDEKLSSVTERLSSLGATIFAGHAAAHLPQGASLLVYSSAVSQENPEIVEAKSRKIPVIRRAEVLAELMRLKYGVGVAGSHGKTTTTSMVACILEGAGLDPTVIIGGRVKSMGSGSKLGKSEYLVAETDESDRSFLLLKPTVAIVTNIDAEHMGSYGTMANLEQAFSDFLSAVPFYGLAVLCVDDARVRSLMDRVSARKITYGFSPDAQLRALNIRHDGNVSHYEVHNSTGKVMDVELPIPGKHMVLNSLAAIAVGIEFGCSFESISKSLKGFQGVERRLELMGEEADIRVINDYGHHPFEIKATLRALRDSWGDRSGKLHVLFQPHRYTRTRDCFVEFLECFSDCDRLYLSEIYAASEAPIEGVSGKTLCDAVNHPSKFFAPSLEEITSEVLRNAKSGDTILCLGAGSVGALPAKLLGELARRPKLRVVAQGGA